MTLHVYEDVIQGTDEWLEQRRGMVTASVVGQLITPSTIKPANNDKSRGLFAQLVSERITGWTDPQFVSDDMLRGTLDEPLAVDVYRRHFDVPVTTVGFMVRDDWGFRLGYSPDGLVGADGLIEVKSRRPKRHVSDVLSEVAPAEHMAQMQAGLLVSGRQWCDYVSYCGGMAMWRVRVEPDERWFEAIVEAGRSFEEAATHAVARYQQAVAGLPMTERAAEETLVI